MGSHGRPWEAMVFCADSDPLPVVTVEPWSKTEATWLPTTRVLAVNTGSRQAAGARGHHPKTTKGPRPKTGPSTGALKGVRTLGRKGRSAGTPARVPVVPVRYAPSGSCAIEPAELPQYNSPFGHCVCTGSGHVLGNGSGHSPFRMRFSRFSVVAESGLIGHGDTRAADVCFAERAPQVLQYTQPL